MTRKQIDASRERRLWISQIIVPTITTVGALLTVPEVREGVRSTFTNLKNNVKNTVNKLKKK